jgi:glycosyltransferase involved in cell wall biosynthesis
MSVCEATTPIDHKRAAAMGQPLRVCFVIDRLFPAGIELQLLLLIKRLDRSRVEPLLCLLDGTDEQTRSLEPKDCPVIRLGVQHLCRPSSVPPAFRLARFFRREKVDLVHPLFPDSLYFGTIVAKLAGVACVAGFQVSLGFWMTRRDRWFGRWVNRWVDGTVANCEACRRAVVADWRVPAESVTIIPNGVDLSRFASANGDISHLPERPGGCFAQTRDVPACTSSGNGAAVQRVGIVANLRPIKNIESFVRAAGELVAKHPQARFEIAGEGESRGPLQDLIDGLGLADRVALRGSVADVPAFLRSLDVAVLCSLSEGSPNAIMEYMAAGLPTVATDVGGNAELVEHEVTGLVVPSGDDRRLASAIGRLLREGEFAARLGRTARERAFAQYGVDAQARRYEEFYLRTCSKKRGTPVPCGTTP